MVRGRRCKAAPKARWSLRADDVRCRGQQAPPRMCDSRSAFPAPQRTSIRTLRPTSQPKCPQAPAGTHQQSPAPSDRARRRFDEDTDAAHTLRCCALRRERQRRRAAKQCNELAPLHSITSSARARSVGGTSRPSALAVLRLMTSSYLVGALHRQVGGLLALEDAVDVAGRTPVLVDEIGSIGDQAAGRDVVAVGVDRRQLVPGRQRDDQLAVNDRRCAPRHDQTAIRRAREGRDRRARSRRASRTSIGLTSTPNDGATDWIAPNWPIAGRIAGIPKDRRLASRPARSP